MPQRNGNKARRVTEKITMGRKTVPCGCLLKDLRQDGLLMIALGSWRYRRSAVAIVKIINPDG